MKDYDIADYLKMYKDNEVSVAANMVDGNVVVGKVAEIGDNSVVLQKTEDENNYSVVVLSHVACIAPIFSED